MDYKDIDKTENLTKNPLQKNFYCVRNLSCQVFLLSNILAGMMPSQFTPVSGTIEYGFDVKPSTIAFSASLIQVANIVAAFPANYIILKLGLKKSLIISMAMVTVGGGIRMFVNQSFYFIEAGQFIIGLAIPIVMNSQLAFIQTWYTEKQRGIYISIFGISNPIGTCLGFVLPTLLVQEYPGDKEKTRNSAFMFQMYNVIAYGVMLVLTAALFTNAPLTPVNNKEKKVSISDTDDGEIEGLRSYENIQENLEENLQIDQEPEETSLGKQICWILSNRIICLWMGVYSIGWGCLPILGATITQQLSPYDRLPDWTGAVIVVAVIFTGLFATTLYSLFQLRKPNQSLFQQFVFIGSIACGLTMVLTLHQEIIYLLLPVGCVYGAFSLCIIPIVLDQVVEICPAEFLPTVNTLQAIAAQAVSASTTIYFGFILNAKTKAASKLCWFIFIGYYVIGLIIASVLRCCIVNDSKKKAQEIPKKLDFSSQVLAEQVDIFSKIPSKKSLKFN